MSQTDLKALVHKGMPPNHCCCDSTLRILPNGEFAVFFLTGGVGEPDPANHVAHCRSTDPANVWHDAGPVLQIDGRGCTLSEVYIEGERIVMLVSIHDGHFGEWQNATIESTDNGHTWSAPQTFAPLPRRGFVRNRVVTSWGEWLLPYQSYDTMPDPDPPPHRDGSFRRPLNGVFISGDGGQSWETAQTVSGAKNWAESTIAELSDGALAMLVRSDGDGCLLRSDSRDRGRTWSPLRRTDIPNPGSKTKLHRLRDGRILLVHNPNPQTKHPNSGPWAACNRNPLAIWISDDDMQSWRYRRVLTDFPGMLAYPDGVLDEDHGLLHFAFDYNRHDVIYWGARLP